uniref:G_PROTEIN_RECEP_F1_2 domain-containing protein n=1 Tax=Steinernema glaseri TaxID=37863 RepID=A0A1I7ZLZ3_9BILA
MAMNDADVERAETASGWYETVYKWLCQHYFTTAYFIVICAYFIGFAEYLYLRLTAYFIPEITVYRRICEKRSEEIIGKTGVHYITILFSFIVLAALQLFAFFLLTISSKLPSNVPEVNEQQRQERPYTRETRDALFVQNVREKLHKTMYPTLLVYVMCSIIVCLTLFYMVGVTDSLDKGLSFVALLIFDVFAILYFIAFPLIAFFFHPDIKCWRSRESSEEQPAALPKDSSPGNTVRLINYTQSPRSAVPLRMTKIVTTV